MMSSSARSTAPYQTLAARPSRTAPTTTAPGATHASASSTGRASPTAPISPGEYAGGPGKSDRAKAGPGNPGQGESAIGAFCQE
jgi:hypothetical protein